MRGGQRPGAGRPVGALTKRTRAVAEAAVQGGLAPLDVMLKAMREHYAAGRWDEAASIAKDAAPYVHPRLAAIQHAGPGGGDIIVKIMRFARPEGSLEDQASAPR